MKLIIEDTDWLEINNLGDAFGFFCRALPYREWTFDGILQLAIDSVWH